MIFVVFHNWSSNLQVRPVEFHDIDSDVKYVRFLYIFSKIIVMDEHIISSTVKNDVYKTVKLYVWLSLGGNRTMVAAATIVSMAAAKKAQQNVFALYHSYNRTILLGFTWILDFNFKIVLVLRRRYLIPIWCNNGKRKMWPWRWLHHFDFQHWRWLHALMTMVASFRAGNFWHTHTADPLQTNMLIGCLTVVKCDRYV